MDRGALLTASRAKPHPYIPSPTELASQLGPTLGYVIHHHLPGVLGAVSVFLCLRAYYLLATATLLCAGRILLGGSGGGGGISSHKNGAVTTLGAVSVAMSGQIMYGTWESPVVKGLRRRFFHEFATFILGGGNALILMLFWPGWLVLAGTSCALWFLWR
ncbi:hypothetical protein ACRE_040440 [Hapsidospora chrysogenum ATCC 11550]|uniref:Uncharacterized protein n=1 Tax=Hapsidospora chrysogenum (strain ATCC 11550 / CBS 779.69 / DSM 880 / IAM 14645 / JCM 23072 / IMI 49137) TaxID=857340 RepID=A0A086T734_HAPC1|nr:hypothetical protein ACRE_040440 [Hapsidospora chrysogenum ATCC 11550]